MVAHIDGNSTLVWYISGFYSPQQNSERSLRVQFDMISLTIAPWLPGECKCPHRCFYGWILCGYVCSCSRIRVGVQCDCNKPQMATHKLLVPYAQHTGPHGPKRDNTAESLTKVRLDPSAKVCVLHSSQFWLRWSPPGGVNLTPTLQNGNIRAAGELHSSR